MPMQIVDAFETVDIEHQDCHRKSTSTFNAIELGLEEMAVVEFRERIMRTGVTKLPFDLSLPAHVPNDCNNVQPVFGFDRAQANLDGKVGAVFAAGPELGIDAQLA